MRACFFNWWIRHRVLVPVILQFTGHGRLFIAGFLFVQLLST